MTGRNVEIVREAWAVYARRGIAAVLDCFADDCVCEDFPQMPDRTTYRGRQGALEWYESFARMWGDLDVQLLELIEAGEDVVAIASLRGRGKESGADVGVVAAYVYELRQGKIARARAFTSKNEGLTAAGILAA